MATAKTKVSREVKEMSVEVMRMKLLPEGDGKTKAFLDITFGGCLVIKGFRVVQGQKGLFFSWPQQKASNNKFYGNAFSLTRPLEDTIEAVVMDAYNEATESVD
jgi:stage V sporulation protein G